jgi:hypothetical protein
MESPSTSLPDIKEALNEYFKLKLKYEGLIMANKKKIMNNITLSNKEKRSEFLKLKPKCINCKRPGGTIFKTTFFEDIEKADTYREHSATCGIIADPCNLNIKIQIGKVELLPELLNYMEKDIKEYKNEIIDHKNKLLFGYLTTDEALKKFDDLKDNITTYTSLYEQYLEHYNKIVDNEDKKEEINESITETYIQIDQIKECIKKMNETNNVQYARDAVNIYNTTLLPLLSKIRNLKYNESMVYHNDDTNTYNLIQNRYSIFNLSFTSFQNRVVKFNVGFEAPSKKKPLLIIESSDTLEEEKEEKEEKEGEEKEEVEVQMIPRIEPTYGEGKDGISWNNSNYTNLWNKLPNELKTALRSNHEWITEFMYNCVNSRSKSESCKFTEPPNLIIPPNPLPNGNYDFGNNIYNDVFNKLPNSTKDTYLTMYNEKDGIKNYNLLRNNMNELVSKELKFNKGYF